MSATSLYKLDRNSYFFLSWVALNYLFILQVSCVCLIDNDMKIVVSNREKNSFHKLDIVSHSLNKTSRNLYLFKIIFFLTTFEKLISFNNTCLILVTLIASFSNRHLSLSNACNVFNRFFFKESLFSPSLSILTSREFIDLFRLRWLRLAIVFDRLQFNFNNARLV